MSADAECRLPVILDPGDLVEWLCDNEPRAGWSAEDIYQAAVQVGRNAAPALLLNMHHEGILLPPHCVALVAGVWTMCEFPTAYLDADEWSELFRMAGYTRIGYDEGLARRWPRRRKPVTLYRGAHHGRERGWSWTTSLDTARWFAARDLGHGTGTVWTTTVAPDLLLARIDARGEGEFVVDPETLGPVVEVGEEKTK